MLTLNNAENKPIQLVAVTGTEKLLDAIFDGLDEAYMLEISAGLVLGVFTFFLVLLVSPTFRKVVNLILLCSILYLRITSLHGIETVKMILAQLFEATFAGSAVALYCWWTSLNPFS